MVATLTRVLLEGVDMTANPAKPMEEFREWCTGRQSNRADLAMVLCSLDGHKAEIDLHDPNSYSWVG